MTHLTAQPIITLTTDFGLKDHYAGTMKGVILSRCPQAQIVDVSHGVPAFSVLSGAYTIAQAAHYFPAGAIHVVVIDPGVGTSRRAIVAVVDGHTFIAPDNGVLTLVLQRAEVTAIREIVNQELLLHPVSSTFHGRDIFGPVAGALAAGTAVASVGPLISEVKLLAATEPEAAGPARWRGIVLSVDQFGNVVTNFPAQQCADAVILIGGIHVRDRYQTFDAGPESGLFLYAGSSGYIEVGANRASAAEALRIAPGDSLELSRGR